MTAPCICKTADIPGHARKSALLAETILQEHGFALADIERICTAISHHSDKSQRHDPYSEALKDADVLERWLTAARYTAERCAQDAHDRHVPKSCSCSHKKIPKGASLTSRDLFYARNRFSRSALVTTHTLENAMAAPANTGESSGPPKA